jgi:hypothetical protein
MILSTTTFILCMAGGVSAGAFFAWITPKLFHPKIPLSSECFLIDVSPCNMCECEEPLLNPHVDGHEPYIRL